MGYYIYGEAIDVSPIVEIFGSNDQNLYNDIINKIKAGQQDYSSVSTNFSIDKALYSIIFGEAYEKKFAHMYAYAFIEICNYLGRDLPYQQELKLGYETDLVDRYLEEDFGIDLKIVDFLFIDGDIDFLKLPAVEDWPAVGILQKDRIDKLNSILEPINIENSRIEELWNSDNEDDEDKACAYQAIMGIKQNLKFCIDNNLSLAIFCH